jgi:hypothetical protein
MSWYWNETIYVGLWVFLVVPLFIAFLVSFTSAPVKEGFEVAKQDPLDLEGFFEKYQVKDICEIFQPVFESVTTAESVQGKTKLSEEEARERAKKTIAAQVPNGPLRCPLELPKEKDVNTIFGFMKEMDPLFLATCYATLLYSAVNLQISYNKIVSSLQQAAAARQGFEDMCTPAEAEAKRKLQPPSCKLPEEVSPEQKAEMEAKQKEAILAKMEVLNSNLWKWREDKGKQLASQLDAQTKSVQAKQILKTKLEDKIKDKGEDADDDLKNQLQAAAEDLETNKVILEYLQFSQSYLAMKLSDVVVKCKDLITKIAKLKKQLEKGDYSAPSEGYENYFVSPLH